MSKYKSFFKSLDNKITNYQYCNNYHTIDSLVRMSNNKYNDIFHSYYKQYNASTGIPTPIEERNYIEIHETIDSLQDIIQILEKYPKDKNTDYNIQITTLHKIKPYLIQLDNMIGMKQLKDEITEQILYFVQGLQDTEGDYMHTCIYGPPGTGKTEVAKLIGHIYKDLGILKKGSFRKVTRADMIASYLGQTAIKTREVIKESLGGVLFIDEAYALGNREKRDSFAKECIDTLCESLSNHKNELMVIIAGYEEDLQKCFFSYNKGLESRFTWSFNTEKYNASELYEIFIKKVHDAKWKINKNDIQSEWFDKHINDFKYFGRDMETLFSKVKIAHSKRVFCLSEKYKRTITREDLENGFNKFMLHKYKKQDVEKMSDSIQQMYL